METIIQQNTLHFTKLITEKATSDKISDIDALSEELLADCKAFARELVEVVAAQINICIREDKTRRKEEGLVIKEKDRPRELLTGLGTLHLNRDYYFDKNSGSYVYPFDQITGLKKYERIGDTVSAKLVNNAADYSYARSAEIATGGDVSRQTVRNHILKVTLPDDDIPEEQKEVETLLVYADEDHVHMQRPDKQKGKWNMQVPLVTVAEGVLQEGKNRNRLFEAKRFVDIDFNGKNLWNNVAGYISATYDTEKIKRIIVYGDGGTWIKHGLEEYPQTAHIMDEFHFGKRLTEISKVFPKRNVKQAVMHAIGKNDKDRVDRFMQDLMLEADEISVKKTQEFGKYLMNHWDEIVRMLTMDVPGSCTEAQVSHVLSERFSRNPKGWSKEGLGKLSCIRISKLNGRSIEAEDFKRKEQKCSYAQYAEEQITKSIAGAFDWSIFDGEPLIYDRASGTQIVINACGTNHGVIN